MSRQVYIWVGIIVIILLIGAGFLFTRKTNNIVTSPQPSPTSAVTNPISTPSPSITNTTTFCTPQNVQAGLTLSPGAGNVYGTFTLKNISSSTCQIIGGSFISPQYDTSTVKNITITDTGQTQSQPFDLAPNQSIYSQVHYPNGPQCQSVGLNQTPVTFSYKISPTDSVSFKTPDGKTQQIVQTCKSPTDMTEIQIWNMSTKPITPQSP